MPRWAVVTGAVLLLGMLVSAAVLASRWESGPMADADAHTVVAATTPLPPSPTPTPAIVMWADGVCVARDALIASVVEVAGTLEYDPQDPASLGEQFQRQIPGQLSGVDAAATELGAALGDIPVDYAEAAAAIPLLQQRIDALGGAKDQAMGDIDAAQAAGDPISAGIAWLRAAAAAKATLDAALLVRDSLGELVGSADGDVRDAFGAAPRCSDFSLG
jgi:hypothetical protein